MAAPKVMRRSEPKPCPRCYAPMRLTATGFECARHGAPAPAARPPVAVVVPRRTAAKPKAAPRKSTQTERLIAHRETIVARNHAGESISSIAADLWQTLGYTNQHVCASKIVRFLKIQGVSTAPIKPGPPAGTRPESRFTDERLAEVQTALATGTSIWAFAEEHWQDWGFPSRIACDSLIRKWLRAKAAA